MMIRSHFGSSSARVRMPAVPLLGFAPCARAVWQPCPFPFVAGDRPRFLPSCFVLFLCLLLYSHARIGRRFLSNFRSRVVALSNTVKASPCLDFNTNFKLAVSFPTSASCRTRDTEFLKSGWVKFCTRFLPIVSLEVNPEISAAFLFHPVTMKFRSTPKIGAFALSMSRDKSSATRS